MHIGRFGLASNIGNQRKLIVVGGKNIHQIVQFKTTLIGY